MTAPLHYEDFAVGQTFESAPTEITRDRIVEFAREFDPQPQHLDEASAAHSHFGTLVASGWHTGALTMRLQLDAMFHRIPGGAMGAQLDRVAWKRPVLPGDRLRAVIEVLAMRSSRSRPQHGLLTLRTTTLNGRDEVVMEMQAAVLVPRRDGPGAKQGVN